MEHTPGPWRATAAAITSHPLNKSSYSLYAPGEGVGTIIGHYKPAMFLTEQEASANARLIAAAPELLKALEGTLPALDSAWERAIMDTGAPIPAQLAKIEEGMPEANSARAAIKAARKS